MRKAVLPVAALLTAQGGFVGLFRDVGGDVGENPFADSAELIRGQPGRLLQRWMRAQRRRLQDRLSGRLRIDQELRAQPGAVCHDVLA